MTSNKFYDSKPRYTTLSGAQTHMDSNKIQNIVILPPSAGYRDVDSDVEELLEESDEGVLFEPAGVFEVDDIGSDSDSWEEETKPTTWRTKTNAPSWKKSTFDRGIPSCDVSFL